MAKMPLSGDVVIHRQIHSPAVYLLGMFGDALQFSHLTYEAAADQAAKFALKESIDAWYTTDEVIFECVASHRPAGT